jgi:hypothetical protein
MATSVIGHGDVAPQERNLSSPSRLDSQAFRSVARSQDRSTTRQPKKTMISTFSHGARGLAMTEDFDTVAHMNNEVRSLFAFIRSQLMDPEHPLNKSARCFASNFVDFYSNEILANTDRYHLR